MYLKNLFPNPVSCTENEAEKFVFGAQVDARVSGLSAQCIERIKTLWHRFSCTASQLSVVAENSPCCRLIIGRTDCILNSGDNYAIHADSAGVCVVGKDASSLMNGIMTLMQMICPDVLSEGQESLYISSADIHDAPAMGFRAIHLCIFPGSTLSKIEKAIHLAGFLKLSHVILEFWGTFRYECIPYWSDRSFSREELLPLVQLAQSYGMEVIPMINHFGHASQSRALNGRHVVLDANPRLARLFEPDGWTWCLSNPDTYKLLAEMRAEMIDFCGSGQYFHLGFDEAYSFASCDRCRKRVPHELLAEYLNHLTDDLCQISRRPIIWHDELIRRSDFGEGPIVANGQSHGTEKALDLLDRRMIMADWQYDYRNGFNPTTAYFIEKGFDTVVCPWDNHENIQTLSIDVRKYGAYGMILTTWHHLENFLRNSTFWANCAWKADRSAHSASGTESAALLRTLYPANGNFLHAGWSNCEVEF